MGTLTTVLTIVGAVIGGLFFGGNFQAGAAIGALIGTLIEGPPDVDPPTVGEVLANGASEGDGMQRFIGADVAIGGELIWRGEQFNFKVKKKKQHVANRYFLPCAISLGRTMTDEPIVALRELYANGRLHYSSYEAVSITGTDVAATLVSVNEFDPLTETTSVVQTYLDLTTTSTSLAALHVGGAHPQSGGGSVFFNDLLQTLGTSKSGTTIIGGFTGGATANNGSFVAVSVSTNRLRMKHQTSATYAFVTAAAGDVVTITQTESHYLKAGIMTIHPGGVPQDPDDWIVANEGAANVPNYDGLVYVSFGHPDHILSSLEVTDFGLSVPTFRARIKERTSLSLAGAVHDILVGYGMEECEVDTDDAVGVFRGYSWREPRSIPDVLAPLSIAYNLVTQEKDERFRVFHRLSAETKVIPERLLGAQDGTQGRPIQPIEVEPEDPRRIAAEVSFGYLDPDRGLQPGTIPWRRAGLQSNSAVKYALPVTLDKDQALKIAKRTLYAEQVITERHRMQLPPSRLLTYESDALQTESNGRSRLTMTTRVARGSNFLMEVEGRREEQALYANETGIAGDSLGTFGQPGPTGDPQVRIADIAPLDVDAAFTPTLYYGAVREGQGAGWNGAELHESTDGGASFELLDGALGEAAAGLVVGTIPTGPVGYWDLGTTITVDVFADDAPASATDADVLSGAAGWWLFGGEVVGVVAWASLGDGRYAGTRLLRGLMDTAEQVDAHAPSETCVRLRGLGNVEALAYSVGSIGQQRTYSATGIGNDPADSPQKTVTLAGQSVRPFSGAYASGASDTPGAGDWTISWEPRTRLPLWDVFGSQAFDDAETVEEYEVEVYDDDTFTTLVRTITADASANGSVVDTSVPHEPTALYDADDIAADGVSATTLYLRIFQVGQIAGQRSKPYEVTIT